jgi:predicted amidohydrolase
MSGDDLLRVALGQFAPSADGVANSERIRALATVAHKEGADLLVCPEYSQGFLPQQGPDWVALAESFEGPFVSALQQISVDHDGLVIIAGMLVTSGAKPRNTMVAVGPNGLLGRQEKIHLYDAFGANESQWVTPGDITPPDILEFGSHRVGVMACYDLRFPEVARRLVDAGASCIVVPAQWVPGPHKVQQWATLLRARAIENQCFVVACGHPEPYGIGHSMVVDPLGNTVSELDAGEGVIHEVVSISVVEQTRAANPIQAARRFGVTPL